MKKHLKFKLISLCSILLVAFVALSLRVSLPIAFAETYPKPLSLISNNTFNSTEGSSQPYTPRNWEVVNPNSATGVKAGVVSTSAWKPTDIGLTENDNPGKPNTNNGSNLEMNLFVNAESEDLYYGYQSSSFSLEANSYYQLDIVLVTANGAHASINIKGMNSAYITNIITPSKTWTTYSIFIQTGDDKLEGLKLELMLGNNDCASTGAVFFNSVSIVEHSATTYARQCPISAGPTQLVVDLKTEGPATLPDGFANAGFDSDALTNGWTVNKPTEGTVAVIIDKSSANLDEYKTIKTPNLVGNPNILYIENTGSAWQTITSQNFTIPGNSFAKISFWAKTDLATPRVHILDKVVDGEDVKILGTAKITASAGSATHNGWKQYNIVIEGDIQDREVALQIEFGTEEAKIQGYMGFDNVTIQQISRSRFSKGGDASVSLKPAISTDKFAIKNGSFTSVDKMDFTSTAPFTPSYWDYFANNNNEELNGTHGVIDSNSGTFTHPLGHTMTNPATHEGSIDSVHNNMIMLYNTGADTQGYRTSSLFTLSGNTYYQISFYVNSLYLTPNSNAYVKIYSATNDITYFDLNHIDTEGAWKQYSLYIKVGSEALDVKFEFGFENQGICFFDNIACRSSLASLFDKATVSNTTFKIDLKNEDFAVRPIDLRGETTSTLYAAQTWIAETVGGATPEFGILNLDNEAQKTALGLTDLSKSKNDNVFVVKATLDTHFANTSKNIISLKANSYYKITINLATKALSSITGQENYGAFVTLTGFKDVLQNINTNGEYQEYTLYVTSDKAMTSAVCFGLGQPGAICSGTLLCDSIKVEESTKEEYNDSADAENSLQLAYVTEKTDTNKEEENEEKEKFHINPATLWAIIPSALFGVVIIVAVVVILVRKTNLPQKIKNKSAKAKTKAEVKNPAYDRNKTQQFKRTAKDQINMNEKEIVVIKNKIAEIEGDLGKIETEHQVAVEQIKEDHKKMIKAKKAELEELVKAKENEENTFKASKHTAKEEKEFAKTLAGKDKEIASLQKFIEKSKPNLKEEKALYEGKKASKHADKSALEAKIDSLTSENERLKNPNKK